MTHMWRVTQVSNMEHFLYKMGEHMYTEDQDKLMKGIDILEKLFETHAKDDKESMQLMYDLLTAFILTMPKEGRATLLAQFCSSAYARAGIHGR